MRDLKEEVAIYKHTDIYHFTTTEVSTLTETSLKRWKSLGSVAKVMIPEGPQIKMSTVARLLLNFLEDTILLRQR